MKNQTQQQAPKEVRQPTHEAKIRRSNGEKSSYERIGVAWQRDEGSFYVRLHGTQIVSEGFHLYPIGDGQ